MADRASGASEAPRPKPRRARRVWLRTGEIILLAVAAFCLVVLVTQDLSLVTGLLYSPLAIVLLVVVFVEYLIIKGGDRSRLYLLELERMHEREQEHVAQTRRALEEIRGALESCRASAAPDEKSDS
ncbi:hypothetical protein AMJ85_06485, partial [candidate division BRC1 bacterium SM23_51]